jgi:CelD/BcsL family acetyltransferase involved in cellulose biosynthesis
VIEVPHCPLPDESLRAELLPIPNYSELAAEWQGLEQRSICSFFNCWSWIGTWLATLPDCDRVRLLRLRRADATVGLAIVGYGTMRYRRLVRSRCLNLNVSGLPQYDCITIEHNAPLSSLSVPGLPGEALVRWFATQHRECDEIYLPGVDSPIAGRVVKELGLLDHTIEVPSYLVDLQRIRHDGDLMGQLSANTRQQLRRALRYWSKCGELRIEAAKTADAAHRYFNAMKRLHILSWQRRGKPHAFVNPYFEEFHESLIDRTFDQHAVELLRVSAGDVELGYLYNLRYRDRTYAYQTGFVEDAVGRPGYVGHYLAIMHARARGAAVYDFLAGRNQLKESLSTHRTTMYWIRLQRPYLRFRALHSARRIKNHSMAWSKVARMLRGMGFPRR